MGFSIQLEYAIRAPAEFVFEWWTDLSAGDTELATPLKRREILSKSDMLIVLRDEEEMYWRRMIFDVKVHLDRKSLSWFAEYEGKVSSARSKYRLISTSDIESKLLYSSQVSPKGRLTKLFSPIVSLFVRRVFKEEMNRFKKAIEEEYAKSLQGKQNKSISNTF